MNQTHLFIGGLVAVGFDPTGRYLLTVSHSGSGVYDTSTWERVARDEELAYPEDGMVEGIGPIAGQRLKAIEINYDTGQFIAVSPFGDYDLFYEAGMVAIRTIGTL